jgi:hypothetical protein
LATDLPPRKLADVGNCPLHRQSAVGNPGIHASQPPPPPCVVNATGSNNINLATGTGPVSGDFRIVTQEAGTVDIEEAVQRRGNFRGQMDLSQIAFGLITMDGSMTAQQQRGSARFRGVFRIPFLCGPDVYCYMSSGPDATPTGPVLVQPDEYALGYPTVRLDIYFE